VVRGRDLALIILVTGVLSTACSSQTGSTADSGSTGDAVIETAASATVMGTLTLPGTATGKHYEVRIVTAPGAATLTPVAMTSGTTTGSTTLAYSIANVPAGTYYVLAFVDVNGTGGTSSTPGDYAGWFGEDANGNPPAAPNAVVPASGTATFNFSLVLR
jgi:hypothetical protein